MNHLRHICSHVVLLILVVACASAPVGAPKEGPAYSLNHLDFKKWNRTQDCCVAEGKKIAISSGGTHASKIGLEIHEKGGNAVDVAVATAFALAVERPHSAGLGGGGFMTISLREPKVQMFVDFRETAPARAKKNMYVYEGRAMPAFSRNGGLAVATPGFVKGLHEVHEKWGKLPWKDLIAPSVELARKGFEVYPSLSEAMERRRKVLVADPYARRVFLRRWRPMEVGMVLRQIHLSHTLELIAKEGPKAFYDGWISQKIVDAIRPSGGILTRTDLRKYEVKYRKPIRWKWQGYEFLSAPPPSAGGVMMAQMMRVLDSYNLDAQKSRPGGYVHLVSEVMKHAYADRSLHVGDPDFVKVPTQWMMSAERAAEIRKKVNLKKATPAKEISPGTPMEKDLPGTTHLSILDSDGNGISATLTINGPFGSGVVVPRTGIVLNNEMDDFSIKPGTKNLYGLTGGEANAVAPGKRPVSSMSPTLVLEGNTPILAVGAAGGSRIISGVFQTMLNYLVVFPDDLKQSVFAPRLHHQWVPDKLEVEPGFSEVTVGFLKGLGHEMGPPPYPTKVSAVARDGNTLTAVFEPRDEGGVSAK